jgi:hypothetical protein
MWDSIRNFYMWWPCSKLQGGNLDYLIPKGWQAVGGVPSAPGIYTLPQGGGKALPFMSILRKYEGADAGHLLVVLRGTNSEYEWEKGESLQGPYLWVYERVVQHLLSTRAPAKR